MSWEGPYLFVRYLDGKGSTGQDEGLTCIIKGGDNKHRDPEEISYCSTPDA